MLEANLLGAAEDKNTLRGQIQLRLKRMDPKQGGLWSEDIVKQLKKHPKIQLSILIAAFMPMKHEADLLPLFAEWAAQGKKVAIPPINVSTDILNFSEFETNSAVSFITDSNKIVILVPGLAFDVRGGRLGRGKGCYDRFLKTLPSTIYKIGICFASQLVEKVPMTKDDVFVDEVITNQI